MRKRSKKDQIHSVRREKSELKRRRASKIKKRHSKRISNSQTSRTAKNQDPVIVSAPANFSLLQNRHEVLNFFSRVQSLIRNKYLVFIDISEVKALEPEALLYLLSNLDRIKEEGNGNLIMGNTPNDPALRALLKCSGFYKYVHTNDPLGNSPQVLRIESGTRVKPEVAKKVKDFAMQHLGVKFASSKALYADIIECMANTFNHAYLEGKDEIRKWWIMALKDDKMDSVHFIFLDNGRGIPKTIRKRAIVEAFKDESSLIFSAMKGELRTQTGLPWRGKGLPRIHESLTKNEISNLVVISGKGYYESQSGTVSDSGHRFQGTLLAWDYSRKP